MVSACQVHGYLLVLPTGYIKAVEIFLLIHGATLGTIIALWDWTAPFTEAFGVDECKL